MHFAVNKNQFITWISIKSVFDALQELSAPKGSSQWIDFFIACNCETQTHVSQ